MATADPQEEKLLGTDDNGDGEMDGVVKIGLVGESGSGKSSFVNAIMRVNNPELNNSVETAETSVTGTTSESKYYRPYPSNQNIKLYDLPGFGTPKYPNIKTYYKELKLADKYDAFLLFTRATFTANSQSLAKHLESKMKPFIFVRTCIDVNVNTGKTTNPKMFDENKMIEEIRENIQEGLKNLDSFCREQIFIISNVRPEEWEFGLLNDAISDELSNRKITACMMEGLSIPFKQAKLFLIKNWENLTKADAETLRQITESAVRHKGLEGAQKMMKAELDQWKSVKIRLAIIGETGVGKSSFINAFRGITNYDKPQKNLQVAPIGVTETTMTVKPYRCVNSNITLFDCPGIGTPKTKSDIEAYCRKIGIKKYDAFIIMTAKRFTNYAGELAKMVESIKKPFFFARSQIDVDYFSKKSTNPKTFNDAKMMEEIAVDCSKNLKGVINDDKDIFLISNLCRRKWDFPRLIDAIENRLPPPKRECFLFSMDDWSKNILNRKVETLKGRIKFVAFFFSIIPKLYTTNDNSRQNDFELIVKKVKFYREKLGFPKQDSEEFGMMSSKMQNKVRNFHFTTEMTVKSWLEKFNPKPGAKITEFPPWLDVEEAKKAPYEFVSSTLHHVLDEMKEIALEILEDLKIEHYV